MDSSIDPPGGTAISAQKTKHDVKGPSSQRRGIFKSTTIKKHLHKFAADPTKGSRERNPKELAVSKGRDPHRTNVSASSVAQEFSFQRIETLETMAQSHASTISSESMTDTDPSPMSSAVPTPILPSSDNFDPPLHSLCNSTPMELIPASHTFVSSASVSPSCNEKTPWSTSTSCYNTISQPLLDSSPLTKESPARKRSGDALGESDPKRQKISSSDLSSKVSMNRQKRSPLREKSGIVRTSTKFVSNASTDRKGPPGHELDVGKLSTPSPTSTRGLSIPSLLNPQDLPNKSQEAHEPSWNSVASINGGGHVPVVSPTSEAAALASIGGQDNRCPQTASLFGQVNAAEHARHTPVDLFDHDLVSLQNPFPESCLAESARSRGNVSVIDRPQGAIPSSQLDPTKLRHTSMAGADRNTFGGEGLAIAEDHVPGKRPPGGHNIPEELRTSSINLVNESQIFTVLESQGPSSALGNEELPQPFDDAHNDSYSRRIGVIAKKRKYDNSEETRTGRGHKRIKTGAIQTTPANKPKGGRPKNPPKPPKVRTSLPTLTSKNPVKHFPLDLWGMVFGFSTPKFLLKAQGVNKLFNLALQYSKCWESARRTTYPGCPDPPAGMSEREYAFHLEDGGCQAMIKDEDDENEENEEDGDDGDDGENGENARNGNKCNGKARKTYWAFQKKWCAKHLRKRVIASQDVQNLEEQYPDLHRLLPSASFDSWGSYLCAGTPTTKPAWLRSSPYRTRYLKDDVEEVCREYDRIRAPRENRTIASPEEVAAWVDAKAAEVETKVKKRQEIEDWVETRNKAKRGKNTDVTQARTDFFRARALTMNPPLEFDALKHTQAFKNAIEIKKEPSERSWQIMEEKLKEERHYAEMIVRRDEEVHRRGVPTDDFLGFGPRGVENEMTMEGMLVRDLTQAQITATTSAFPNAAETDEWVPRILRGFHDAFQALPDYQKMREDSSEITLTMYHAKVVIEMIEAHFQITRGNKVPTYLKVKCPLCPHKKSNPPRSFYDHVTHIGLKHARSHEGFEEWRMFANRSFPWMRVPWPENMPVWRNSDPKKSPGRWNLGD